VSIPQNPRVAAPGDGKESAPLAMSDAELATRPCSLAPQLLHGRTVVVSGAGSGIGRASAWVAARLGARVVLCGRNAQKLARVCTALSGHSLDCEARALDIRERGAVDQFFADLFTRHGHVDVLINSAGGQFPQAALDFSERGWRAVIDTNLHGTFNMMQSIARHWHKNARPGSIVSIVVSGRGLHQVAHTCAARAGIVAFSECVAVEWAPLGIRVNCIAPGATVSEGWAVYAPEVAQRYAQSSPQRRAGSPWEIAEAALFVAGPAGQFITGQTLHVNGGSNLWGETWTAGKPAWFVQATQAWQQP